LGVFLALATISEFVFILWIGRRKPIYGSLALAFAVTNITLGYFAYPIVALGDFAFDITPSTAPGSDTSPYLAMFTYILWRPISWLVSIWFIVAPFFGVAIAIRLVEHLANRRYVYAIMIATVLASPILVYVVLLALFP
jgi:hypothetical protein